MNCKNCKKYNDCKESKNFVWPCGAYHPISITRADCIRVMCDEELAKFLGDEPPHFSTYKKYLDWLRQPAG